MRSSRGPARRNSTRGSTFGRGGVRRDLRDRASPPRRTVTAEPNRSIVAETMHQHAAPADAAVDAGAFRQSLQFARRRQPVQVCARSAPPWPRPAGPRPRRGRPGRAIPPGVTGSPSTATRRKPSRATVTTSRPSSRRQGAPGGSSSQMSSSSANSSCRRPRSPHRRPATCRCCWSRDITVTMGPCRIPASRATGRGTARGPTAPRPSGRPVPGGGAVTIALSVPAAG